MRAVCSHCRRPVAVCYCAHVPLVVSRTRVVFLQHPRERRVPVGTCRMAHLALSNSELHVGVHFDEHPRIRALAEEGGVAILYPSDEEVPSWPASCPLPTLVVIDGTWSQARKVLRRSVLLRRLPRVALTPVRPGNYRIRREPAPHYLSTIEAVSQALTQLEGEPERFSRMLDAFNYMVERQLEHANLGLPRRHLRSGPRRPRIWPAPSVLIGAEANSPPRGESGAFAPELVQLLAMRPGTGERFTSCIRPRHPLSPSTPTQLELSRGALLDAPLLEEVLPRFMNFLRPDDVLACWGPALAVLLRRAGAPVPVMKDVRMIWRRERHGRPGGVEAAAEYLGTAPPVWPSEEGRGARRLAALEAVVSGLNRG